MSQISVTDPLTGRTSLVESNDAEQAHGVDALGDSLGLVPLGSAHACVPPPPAGQGWRWSFERSAWLHTQTLADAIEQALVDIDSAAGQARRRYVTDVSGQAAVYLRKAEQAREYAAAGFAGAPPPYMAAESKALGITPAQLARQVLDVAALWDDKLSPAIEAARIAGKRAAGQAKTLDEVEASRQAATQALSAI
ncbi:MAG: hypothetical protein ABI433_00995 [Burkholderiaceae bacterium]